MDMMIADLGVLYMNPVISAIGWAPCVSDGILRSDTEELKRKLIFLPLNTIGHMGFGTGEQVFGLHWVVN